MKKPCKACSGRGFFEITLNDDIAQRIVKEAANDWQITTGDLTGLSRRKDIVEARRYVARDLRQRGFALKEIGHALGGRDHSTVCNLLGYPKVRRKLGGNT